MSSFHFHEKTPQDLRDFIETNAGIGRMHQKRFRFVYGDPETGKFWGDIEVGYIGRSTGEQKIALVVYNKRSMGGQGVVNSLHCRNP